MKIVYDKKSKEYIVGESSFSKEAFIAYIESDMLQNALLNEELSIDIVGNDKEERRNAISEEHNIIYFGAPGTGKSYNLNQLAIKLFPRNHVRVTFHPNYLYSNFVGVYKPFPRIDVNGKDGITYKFIPGPLITMLTKAICNPEQDYLLIVEEINRADVAAVFGDTFQLLDRKEGVSEYSIAMSAEIIDYYKTIFKTDEYTESEKENFDKYLKKYQYNLVFPSNFYIWATMNSADQGVKPVDSAFKRRWSFEYIGINDGITKNKDFNNYVLRIGSRKILWNTFRDIINSKLSDIGVAEDKLLGPYFISKSTLDAGEDEITKSVLDKVLMYLFEDAVKPYRDRLFSKDCCHRFSELISTFDNHGTDAFNSGVKDMLDKGLLNADYDGKSTKSEGKIAADDGKDYN